MVAGLMKWGGVKMEEKLHQYVDCIGWATVAMVLLAVIINNVWVTCYFKSHGFK